jgi:hypothetical protein
MPSTFTNVSNPPNGSVDANERGGSTTEFRGPRTFLRWTIRGSGYKGLGDQLQAHPSMVRVDSPCFTSKSPISNSTLDSATTLPACRSSINTPTSLPSARSLPSWTLTTTEPVRRAMSLSRSRQPAHLSPRLDFTRRCRQLLGYLGFQSIRLIPSGDGTRNYIRDARCHYGRSQDGRYHQERYHSQLGVPR